MPPLIQSGFPSSSIITSLDDDSVILGVSKDQLLAALERNSSLFARNSWRDSLQRVVKLMLTDLGSHQAFITKASSTSGDNPQSETKERSLYLYVEKRRIIAALVPDEVEASRVYPVSSMEDIAALDTKHTSNTLSPSRSDSLSSTAATLMLGVRLIWVHESRRRQGIAHRMVDAIRRLHFFGQVVDITQLAFSQPTVDGLAFAQRYCKTRSILSYV